jgi:hypothetical protein
LLFHGPEGPFPRVRCAGALNRAPPAATRGPRAQGREISSLLTRHLLLSARCAPSSAVPGYYLASLAGLGFFNAQALRAFIGRFAVLVFDLKQFQSYRELREKKPSGWRLTRYGSGADPSRASAQGMVCVSSFRGAEAPLFHRRAARGPRRPPRFTQCLRVGLRFF